MRKSNLVARLAIVIMIAFAGGIIVFLTTSVKNNDINATETVAETQMTDVQAKEKP